MKNCFSNEKLNTLARKHGFIKRSGKIDAFTFITSLIFSELNQAHLSLLDLKCDFLSNFNCNVSREAIHKRFTPEAVNFMKALLSNLLSLRLSQDTHPFLSNKIFDRVCIKDSSKFRLPIEFIDSYPGYGGFNKKSSLMNIQYEYDLQAGDWISLEFTKATRNDQEESKTTLENIKKNDLHIRDLGYITMPYLEGVIEREAYFLNRLPVRLNVYQLKDGSYQSVNWECIDRKMQKGKLNYLDLNVAIGEKSKLNVEMIIQPVPEDIYKERIKKATVHAKSKGCQLTKEYKIKAKYNIFITNIPVELLSPKDVPQVYRLRWQIELVFKTWKSNLSIHLVKKMKKERFECQLIAKILWVLINWKFFQTANLAIKEINPGSGCSIFKFYKQALKFSFFLKLIILKKDKLKKWLQQIFIPLIPNLIIETKKGKMSHTQIFKEKIYCLG